MATNLTSAIKQARDSNGRFASKAPPKKKPVKKQKFNTPIGKVPDKLTNQVGFILDCSGSMATKFQHLVDSYNRQIDKLREESLKTGQKTYVTLCCFGSTNVFMYKYVPVQNVKPLQRHEIRDLGMTALRDAVGVVINDFLGVKTDKNTSFLLITLTDGLENQSYKVSTQELTRLVREQTAKDTWSFTFQVPDQHSKTSLNSYGVPLDNINVWETTVEGLKETEGKTSGGITSYMTQRSLGKTKVNNFYTDLSKVSPATIAKKLDDVSSDFKLLEVTKETPIKEFVETKTKKEYIIGSTYYLLYKKERVQAKKQVLVLDKKTNEIFGGEQARTLIGLPLNTECNVTPYNHSGYDIFIASTSVNRVLGRGTKVLVKK